MKFNYQIFVTTSTRAIEGQIIADNLLDAIKKMQETTFTYVFEGAKITEFYIWDDENA